ncbi:hypothetical protein O6P43_033296 [Quillaja saponaria]|uniref:Uncharacterized protein n=1 Tax=Quillaja saponaria TaxID=32244 RepID=A0AAD7KQC9_QUISA|nr:hypothetical protein O6P43_033296 [Quillaja saponaria]
MMSPSCFSGRKQVEYSRLQNPNDYKIRWRNLVRRLVMRGSKSLYGSKVAVLSFFLGKLIQTLASECVKDISAPSHIRRTDESYS